MSRGVSVDETLYLISIIGVGRAARVRLHDLADEDDIDTARAHIIENSTDPVELTKFSAFARKDGSDIDLLADVARQVYENVAVPAPFVSYLIEYLQAGILKNSNKRAQDILASFQQVVTWHEHLLLRDPPSINSQT